MAIFTFDIVTFGANSAVIRYATNEQIFISPFSGATQIALRGGNRFIVTLDWRAISENKRAEVLGFFAQLNGKEHRFRVHDPSHVQRGALGGTPLVMGASQTGDTLSIDAGPTSQTDWLKRNDYINVVDIPQLCKVTADVNTDGSGQATIPITPPLRQSPADDSSVDITLPTGDFIMMTDLEWSNTPGAVDALSDVSVIGLEDIAV